MAQAVTKKEINFSWEGTDKRGNRVKGKAVASTEAMVKADLRRQGIVPIKIKKQSAALSAAKGKKITAGDIAIFSRQMATMMSAGVPLVQSFDIIGKGHENPNMQDLILGIKGHVEGGAALAEALGKYPLYFDDLFVNLVEAGEQAGALETLLDKIATYKEKTEAIKKKIKKALTYPIAVLVVA
ncbi:MAG: type II secretion system F family protein, partial [Gammaproteobacteria bacterium]|nr:type II secretion system F family protein [Gammaproteobacteria bacterium]